MFSLLYYLGILAYPHVFVKYFFQVFVGIGFPDDPTEKSTSMGDFSENVPFSETARQGCRALR